MNERQPSGEVGVVPADGAPTVQLVLPAGRPFDAVGRLVAAGVGARSGLRLDRIEGLQRALEVVRGRPGARGATTVTFSPADGDLRVGVGPLEGSRGRSGLEGVLSSLVDDVSCGSGGDEWIVLRVANAHDEGR